jgi:hypothetical protein
MENEEQPVSYYVRMDLALFTDLRVKKAARKLACSENEILGALGRLWAHAFEHCPDGIFWELDADDLCTAMGVEEYVFIEVLVKTGLLSQNSEGVIFCEGWERHTGEIIKKHKQKQEQNARRQAKFRASLGEKVTLDPALRNARPCVTGALRNAPENVSNAKVTHPREEKGREENGREEKRKKTDRAGAHAHEENSVGEEEAEPIGSLEDAGASPDFASDSRETFLALTDKQDHATLAVIPNAKQNSVAIPKNSKQRHAFEPGDFDLALDWISWAHEQHPHLKLQSEPCAKEIRISRDNTGRTIEQMRNIFEWIKKDDFWSKNCLSPCALNKKSAANGLRKIDNIINSISKDKKTVEKMQYDQWKDEGIKPLF